MTKLVVSLSIETTPLAPRPSVKAVKEFILSQLPVGTSFLVGDKHGHTTKVNRVTVRAVDFDRPRNLKN